MDEPASYFLTLLTNETTAYESVTFMEAILKLGAVLFLVLANSFFVGSEFALVSSVATDFNCAQQQEIVLPKRRSDC
ncbi:MAG: hypothetical protein DMF68_19355 [Acidobacteria bacterium]|nr:MAG: hypothetical protein DMF68_19355 [Acidobacteriota bacterium]